MVCTLQCCIHALQRGTAVQYILHNDVCWYTMYKHVHHTTYGYRLWLLILHCSTKNSTLIYSLLPGSCCTCAVARYNTAVHCITYVVVLFSLYQYMAVHYTRGYRLYVAYVGYSLYTSLCRVFLYRSSCHKRIAYKRQYIVHIRSCGSWIHWNILYSSSYITIRVHTLQRGTTVQGIIRMYVLCCIYMKLLFV